MLASVRTGREKGANGVSRARGALAPPGSLQVDAAQPHRYVCFHEFAVHKMNLKPSSEATGRAYFFQTALVSVFGSDASRSPRLESPRVPHRRRHCNPCFVSERTVWRRNAPAMLMLKHGTISGASVACEPRLGARGRLSTRTHTSLRSPRKARYRRSIGSALLCQMDHAGATRKPPRLVLLGGGTGMHRLLHGLVYWSQVHMPLDITAVICTSDDGGSTGRIRAELGMPAMGDIRNALEGVCSALALSARCNAEVSGSERYDSAADANASSTAEDIAWWRLLGHRLGTGSTRVETNGEQALTGHALGNLVLAALYESCGRRCSRAVQAFCHLLGIPVERCRIWPASDDLLELVGSKASSPGSNPRHSGSKPVCETIRGESNFARSPGRLFQVHVERTAAANGTTASTNDDTRGEPSACPEALEAIRTADAIILGPGSLFTSIAAVAAITPIRDAIRKWSSVDPRSPKRPIYVCNLWTEPGETDGMDVWAHVDALRAILDAEESEFEQPASRIPLQVLIDVSQVQSHAVEASLVEPQHREVSVATKSSQTHPVLVSLLLSSSSSSSAAAAAAAAAATESPIIEAHSGVSFQVDRLRAPSEESAASGAMLSTSKPPGHDPHLLTRALLRLLFHQRHTGAAPTASVGK
jgi:uncharacterized cofD-like protein